MSRGRASGCLVLSSTSMDNPSTTSAGATRVCAADLLVLYGSVGDDPSTSARGLGEATDSVAAFVPPRMGFPMLRTQFLSQTTCQQ